jgi:hypothetical protein
VSSKIVKLLSLKGQGRNAQGVGVVNNPVTPDFLS